MPAGKWRSKSELRSTKSETNPNTESRKPGGLIRRAGRAGFSYARVVERDPPASRIMFGFPLFSVFEFVSDFVLRISNFRPYLESPAPFSGGCLVLTCSLCHDLHRQRIFSHPACLLIGD